MDFTMRIITGIFRINPLCLNASLASAIFEIFIFEFVYFKSGNSQILYQDFLIVVKLFGEIIDEIVNRFAIPIFRGIFFQ